MKKVTCIYLQVIFSKYNKKTHKSLNILIIEELNLLTAQNWDFPIQMLDPIPSQL